MHTTNLLIEFVSESNVGERWRKKVHRLNVLPKCSSVRRGGRRSIGGMHDCSTLEVGDGDMEVVGR